MKRLFGTLVLSALSAGLLTAASHAAGFYGNQSDIRWKTAGTDHFQFMYPADYSEQAATASSYAEAVYDSVINRYRIDLPRRVNVTLNNALYSNGSAIPSENALNLWLTNWDFKIRSSHGWLSDVITHEFSHLVSIENASKVLPSIYGLQLSYTDYYNERTTSNFLTLLPFTLQPLWLAEGTAQYESSRMGFDAWDMHRDMLVRVAALNDQLMPLEYMHAFSDNSLEAELGPYTQGFSLVRYIDKHYGENAVPKIWSEMSRVHRVTLDGALRNVLGISEKELYSNWKKEITEHYQQQKDSLGELVEGIKITTDAFWQDFPVVAGKYVYGVSNFGGQWFDGGVFKMPLTLDSLTDEKSQEDSLVIEGFEGTININDFAKTGFKTKKPWFDKGIDVYEDSLRGPILAYVNYQNRDKDGHAHFDIAVLDTNKNSISVTYLVDAVYPNIDPQGDFIYFVRRENATTRFILSKVPFPKDFSDYVAEDPIDVFVPDPKFKYFNIYSPKASPDGKKLVFSFFDDTKRGIATINVDGSGFQIESDMNSPVDERDPNWLDNNKIIYSSNENGIFNLFEKDLTTGNKIPLTNVVGGAFTPVLSNDTLFFTAYDKDGFSLYKMGYAPFVASTTDTTITVTERDSVLHIADTTWQSCQTEKTLFTDSAAVDSSLMIIKDCVSIPTVATRDSVIKVQDTVKTVTTKEGSKAIVLHGTLPTPVVKKINFETREFAGAEKDYKPLPTVPLFIPILNFSESAPDLTVFGDGQMKVKAGLAAIISDPLKKNTIQLGLLLELGAGLDYINADGLNPRQEKEFFAAWENHSTPIDFGLSYTYANYTSKDTVRYEDVRAHNGDSLGISHYAVPTQALVASAGYSLFKHNDSLMIGAGYNWSDFNLYEDDFSWTYQKSLSAMISFSMFAGGEGEEGSGISGQGRGLNLYYQYTNSDLYRPGTFAESFVVTESGSIKPKYRNFNLHEVGISLFGSLESPLTGAHLAAGGRISGLLGWSTDAKEDTLDSYYYAPIFLEGYPYLRSAEDYTRAGTKVAVAELHYLLPIYSDWRKNFWIFTTRDFYIDVFAQIGAAWNSDWIETDKWTDHRFWDRSVGLSFRMSNKVFYGLPLDISFTLARGLSRIGENDDLTGGRKLKPMDIAILPEVISPTRVSFSIGMGFINSWQ